MPLLLLLQLLLVLVATDALPLLPALLIKA
jgi:hypothetical protein